MHNCKYWQRHWYALAKLAFQNSRYPITLSLSLCSVNSLCVDNVPSTSCHTYLELHIVAPCIQSKVFPLYPVDGVSQPRVYPECVGQIHPTLPQPLLERMVWLLNTLHQEVNTDRKFGGQGGPWEFNLRDLLRWCQLVEKAVPILTDNAEAAAKKFLQMLVLQRFRTPADREQAQDIFVRADLSVSWSTLHKIPTFIQPTEVSIGWAKLSRAQNRAAESLVSKPTDCLLNSQLSLMESIAHCIHHNWPVLLTGSQATGIQPRFHSSIESITIFQIFLEFFLPTLTKMSLEKFHFRKRYGVPV